MTDAALAVVVTGPGPTATALTAAYAQRGLPVYASGAKAFDASRSTYNARPLRKWDAAVGRCRTTGGYARLAVVGDSITQGFYAPARERTGFVSLIRAQMSVAYGYAGTGIVPLYESTLDAPGDPRWTFPGGAWTDLLGAGTTVGLAGSHGREATGVTKTAVFTPVGSVDSATDPVQPIGYNVFYMNGPTTGAFTITIDSGTPQTVTPTTGVVTVGMAYIQGTVLNAKSALTITPPASGVVQIVAVEATAGGPLGNTGIRVSQLGSYGANGSNFTNANSLDFLFGPGVPGHDLMIFMFGTNDFNNNFDPVTEYQANLQVLITAQLASGGDAMLMVPPPAGVTGTTFALAQYAAAAYALAETNNIPVIDLLDRWGSYALANTAGLMADALHPNQAGHTAIANAVMDVLGVSPFVVPASDLTFNTGRGGIRNTAAGVGALAVSGAEFNTAVGYQSLTKATTSAQNTAVGYRALTATVTGGGSTAVGQQALMNSTAADNTAVGSNAAQTITTGTKNIAVGTQALWGVTTGGFNTGIGYLAGVTGTGANKGILGQRNVWLGYQSGPSSAADPSNAVAVGADALAAVNAVAIGSGATATASGSVAIGKDSAGTSATATLANDVVLGTALHTVKHPGRLNIAPRTPTSGADVQGQVGDITADDSYVYAKTSTGWKRAALTSW